MLRLFALLSFAFTLGGCKYFVDERTSTQKAANVANASQALDEDKVFYIADENAKDHPCDGPNVHTIAAMPTDHTNPGRGTFPYKYELVNTSPGATTVVFLPGGPGGTSISNQQSYKKNFPGLNLVLIDPRGVGCNSQGSKFFHFKELRTEQHSQDVLAVIRDAGLKNYIIYGISYGTMIGTFVAADAEKAGLPPKAVVLEGIMGKAFTAGNKQAFDVEFAAFKRDFPEAAKALAGPTFPLGYTEVEWGDVVNALHVYSRYYAYAYVTGAAAMATDDPKRAGLRQAIDAILAPDGATGKNTFYAAVACKEILGKTDAIDFELRSGAMTQVSSKDPGAAATCASVGARDFYDPATYQIKAPLYYFQGSHDPATPPVQAHNHFDAQRGSVKKTWTQVENGGHSPLLAVDQLEPCGVAIWERIDKLQGLDGVVDARGYCIGQSLGLTATTAVTFDADTVQAIKAVQW